MICQLTDAGAALLAANTGPVVVTQALLGSGVNYVPQTDETNIHGSIVYSTVPTAPVAVSGNVVRYSVYVDYDVASFAFGEVGLFTSNGTLFALAAAATLIEKVQLTSSTSGNSIRIDIYLSMVGTNYEMWLDLAESNNMFQVASVNSPDQLPQPRNAVPNMYVVEGVSLTQQSFFAYTDRTGLWCFDGYAYANTQQATVVSSDNQSVTISLSQFNNDMVPGYFGQIILQFATGVLYGLCRYVKTVVINGTSATLGFNTQLAIQPAVGDIFTMYDRQALSTSSVVLPIATTSALGGVIVGENLSVTLSGVLSVPASAFPVSSVNGAVGAVVLTASDISGLATVAKSGSYLDLINAPLPYTLPVATASVLGGVVQPASGNLVISPSGSIDLSFTAVKSVNGTLPDAGTGNVALAIPGLATTSVPGTVQVGSGLSVTSGGVLSVTNPGGVSSFNSRTGAVTLMASDLTAVGGALLVSPAFTGVPTAPTAGAGTATNQLASTAFVTAALLALSGNFAPLSGFFGSFGNPGYFEIPIGGSSKSFIIQWGVTTIAAGVNVVIQTLPVAFSTAYLGGVASDVGVSGFSCSVSAYTSGNPLVQIGIYTAPYSCTTGTIEPHAVVDCTWIVIGY